MAQLYKMLKQVKGHPVHAYYLDDVLKLISARQRKKLEQWIVGRITLELKDDREVIYQHDLDHFFDSITQ